MKKFTIFTIVLALSALLLTGCDSGNVSNRTDGVVDGTNSTNTATITTPTSRPTESTHNTSAPTGGMESSNPTDSTPRGDSTGSTTPMETGADTTGGAAARGRMPQPR